MSKSFVFKIERPSFEFEALLSNGECITLTIMESNINQLAEAESAANEHSSALELTKKHLSENIRGERAQEFIEDLMENGSLSDFYIGINEQFKALKGTKRKN